MDSYDFIIVGGGTAGSVLAARLAETLETFQILLVEAGGKNNDSSKQILGERYATFKNSPSYNWGYKTSPQSQLRERELDYSRGKGLGGSTAINFCVYTRGPRAEYDRWAEIVDDEAWRWKNAHARYKKIERYHPPLAQFEKYINPSLDAYGREGVLDVGFSKTWERGFSDFLEAAYASGVPRNLDVNSGDPTGISVNAMTTSNGRRVTASSAYLSDVPSNLTVLTDAMVEKIIFDGKRAVGVKLEHKTIRASKEVFLCAGAIDSPKLLQLSGIGPAEQLAKHGIKPIQTIEGIGKGLRDHLWLVLTLVQKDGANDRPEFFNNPQSIAAAREQWLKDQTGELTIFQCAQTIGFLPVNKITESDEFKELSKTAQKSVWGETIPTYELLSHTRASPKVDPSDCYLSFLVAFMNPQSTGEILLCSSDPKDDAIMNPNFLSHPFDRRVAIESVRNALEILNKPEIAKHTIRLGAGPVGPSDEEILDYIKETASSMWHMCGTVKMGRHDEPGMCVDKEFRVAGVQALRVVDMSVAPLIPSAHTQAAAFLIGETAAEKIITDYS